MVGENPAITPQIPTPTQTAMVKKGMIQTGFKGGGWGDVITVVSLIIDTTCVLLITESDAQDVEL